MVDEEDDDLQKLETVQRELMEKALARYGTIRAAAAALGMPKSTFADRARQLQLAVPGRKRIAGVARRRYIGLTPPLPTGALGPPPGVPPLPSSVPSLPSLVPSGDEMSVEPEHASEHDGDYGWDDDAGEHELVACADEHEHAGRAGERAPSWPEPAAADAWAPEACAEEPRSAAAADETSMFELSSSDNVLDAFGLQRLPAKAASASTACESGGPANEASASGAVGAACAGDEYFVGPDASTTPDEAPPAHMVTRDSREAL
ncbi:MAG: hypothetical protein JO257_11685 [Deltaproteobacteria bacterium]|nr:hypothetical protein [Deltaproteobacteria bacterium]